MARPGFLELMDSRRSGPKHASSNPDRPLVGIPSRSQYRQVLACGDVLVFDSSFHLSWSLLEAVAAGCAIVARYSSCTEVLKHQHSALLVDFFDVGSLVKALADLDQFL